jgi:hypothetical protein
MHLALAHDLSRDMFQGRPKGTRSKHSPGKSPPLLFLTVSAAQNIQEYYTPRVLP